MDLFRQGDVALIPVKQTKGLKIDENDYILARGEATGHHHRITGQLHVFKDDNQIFCEISEPAELTHQEHDLQVIPPGSYKVVIQREYDLVDGVRRVMD